MGAPITDLRELDFDNFYRPFDERLSVLRKKLDVMCKEALPYWADANLLGVEKTRLSSYGAIVKIVERDVDLRELAGRPRELMDFAIGNNGRYSLRYQANALRKAMAVARTGMDTSKLRELGDDAFQNIVPSVNEEDGSWPVGEFPRAGAVLIRQYGYCILVGVSGYDQWKDDFVARTIGHAAAAFLKEYDQAVAKKQAKKVASE